MDNIEFSSEFDILFNNIMSNAAIGLDEYEKSTFLTAAQEEIIKEIYTGTYEGGSFDKIEETKRYLSDLIRTYTGNPISKESIGLSNSSKFFSIPEDVWFITYEAVKFKDNSLGCENGKEVEVVPTRQDNLAKTLRNPFRGPSNMRALRLDLPNYEVEIISKYTLDYYKLRYLVQPSPIILEDLEDTTINGISSATECKLPSSLHRVILNRAVDLARVAYYNTNK